MTKNSKIKTLRLAAMLSQNQLSRKTNLDRGTISSAENGGNPSELTLSKLSQAFTKILDREITPDDLI